MAVGSSVLALLAAPFQELRPFHRAGGQPPLRAMVVASGPDPLGSLLNLSGAVLRWPWLVPCIVVPPRTVALAPLIELMPPSGTGSSSDGTRRESQSLQRSYTGS